MPKLDYKLDKKNVKKNHENYVTTADVKKQKAAYFRTGLPKYMCFKQAVDASVFRTVLQRFNEFANVKKPDKLWHLI